MKAIIINSGKCGWGKCVFCGWGKHKYDIDADRLIEKFDKEKAECVKIFCSGSFLDKEQFPVKFQKHVAKSMQGKELIIESRPEFVTKESLAIYKGVKLTVAMGLETADDEVLKKLKKGITLEKFKKAAALIHSFGFRVKGYVLVNPPFDYEGLLKKTVNFGLSHCDELVLINTYPHVLSELYDLWLAGKWKPLTEEEFNKKVSPYLSEKVSAEFTNYAFEPRFRTHQILNGVGKEFVTHPFFNVWQDFFARFYKKPEDKEIALFIPCSKRKPYFKSRTHKAIRRAITGFPWYKKVHLIVISNPGVIPVEYSGKYPFDSYNWDERLETPEIMDYYIKINTQRIKDYLRGNHYKKVLSYFKPESESGIALENACRELGIKLIKLADKEVYARLKNTRNPLIHPLMINAFKEKIRMELQQYL